MSDYLVEGYGAAARNPEYDGPYLDGHKFDPAIQFAFAGDPEKQAELQKVIDEHEGTPILAPGGAITIKTADGEPDVVVLTKEAPEVNTVVLKETEVDRLSKEQQEAELESTVEPYADGPPEGTVDDEQDDVNREKVNIDGPSGADEQREGADYNPTRYESPRTEEGTVEANKQDALEPTTKPNHSDGSENKSDSISLS